jgi:hypothetical protein
MVMHKMTPELEKGLPPAPETLEGVGKLIESGLAESVFVSGEGLRPTSQRERIVYASGRRTITAAPFENAKELVAGFVLMQVRSRDEARAWCDRFAATVGDMALFLGPVVEPWDLGMGAKPDDAPLRFLSIHLADERSERDAAPDASVVAKQKALFDEMTAAGALQATGRLASTKKGARVHFERGKRNVLDGPFTESKELIAGYAILDLPSKGAAIEWAMRFGEVVKVHEVEVREVALPPAAR